MKPYSIDLRQRILADADAGLKTGELAEKYSVGPAFVRRLKQRRRETGSADPIPQRHGPLPAWAGDAQRLRDAVRESPDATLDEYRRRYAFRFGRTTLSKALRLLGLGRKKKRPGRPSRTGPT